MAEQSGQIFKLHDDASDPESIDVRRLPHLISGAGASTGFDRIALALEINKALIAMRGPGHEEAESRILVTVLDEHRLDGLVDPQGRSCRKEAVETLLTCGFPHALKVSPEDLAFARTWKPPRAVDTEPPMLGWAHPLRRARRRGLISTGVGQALFLAFLVVMGSANATATALAVLTGLASGGVAFVFAAGKPTPDTQAGFGSALGMLALLQAGCGLAIGSSTLLGAAGTLLGLVLSFAQQYEPRADGPRPGDWDYRPPR